MTEQLSTKQLNDNIKLTATQPNPKPKKSSGLLRSTAIISLMTMISRILGFARDIVLAQIFGASASLDAFVIAFKIPNLLRRLFGEGAFSQAFVPILAEYKERKTQPDTLQFIGYIAGTLSSCLIIVVAIVELCAPIVIMIFAPGFYHDPHRYLLAQHMLHITFPYIFFIAMTAFISAIMNTYRSFAIPAVTPVFLNICLIAAALWLSPYFSYPIYGLAWGVMIAGVVQLVFPLLFLRKIIPLPKPRIGWRDEGVQRVLKLMLPALFGVSVAQIGLLIDNVFASYLPTGSITWLYYSDRLTYLPLGVIGVALATVVLPTLSKQFANNNQQHYSQTLDWALRMILLTAIPAALGLGILSGPLLLTLFHHGAFTIHDVVMTQKSLIAFAIGLPGFMAIKVLGSAFYARKNIKLPVKIAAIALIINITLNFLLIHHLAHAGLALATAISALINALLLFIALIKKDLFQINVGWLKFIAQVIVANCIMVITIKYMNPLWQTWLNLSTFKSIADLFGLLSTAILGYAITLWLCGFRMHMIRPPRNLS